MEGAVVFLDRDGTINEDRGYIGNPDDIILFENAAEAVKRLNGRGIKVIVVTKQSGVGRGYFSGEALDGVNKKVLELLGLAGARIDGIYYCPHTPKDGCDCRKPGTALIARAVAEHGISARNTYVIGDKDSDIELARNISAKGILVLTGKGRDEMQKFSFQPDFVAKDILDAVLWIMEGLKRPYEIVFVDDGSCDNTLNILEGIQKKDPNVVVVSFRKNFGQTAALAAGFDYSSGDIVVTMDADLQNDPGDIPKLLEKIKDHDVVSGWRKERKDPFFSRRLPSIIANRLISFVTGVKLHDYGCTLKAYRREVIKNIKLYGEMHRFIPALASWVGAKTAEVETTHHPRLYGRSKYGISRILLRVLDIPYLER